MKIIKYEKKGSNNYQVYLDNGKTVTLNEDLILKHKLLYKEEIDEFELEDLIQENNNYDIYNKCVNYIGIRLRSTHEIAEYMERKHVDPNLIDEVIVKLKSHKLLDDEVFTQAFIKDKMNFTTMGPFRIVNELEKHQIDKYIIMKYINEIDENLIKEKMDKQIKKIIKSNKNKPNLKNKIYHNLLNLGYSSESILNILNNYDV